MPAVPPKGHRFKKGQKPPKGSGRKKGSINKVSRDVKESIINVYNMLGGDAGLRIWASKERNKKEFYKIWSRLLPIQVKLPDGDGNAPQPPSLQMIFLGTDSKVPPESLPPIDVTPE